MEQNRDWLVVIPTNINILATGLCVDTGHQEYWLKARPAVAYKCLSLPGALFELNLLQMRMIQKPKSPAKESDPPFR